MKLKKVISAALSAAMCAGMISGMAVTAGAATTQTTLSYYKDSTALSEHQYSADTNNDTYTLDDTGKNALAAAKAGDTLTIEYDIESNGTAQYRNGIKLYDQQFYVNCHSKTGVNTQFTTSTDGACHLNGKFIKDDTGYQTAHVKYVFELGEGGKVSKVTPSIKDGAGTEASYSAQDISSKDKMVDTVVLNTADRGSSQDNTYAKMTNFSATLTTTTQDPTINDAQPYSYTINNDYTNPDIAGFTADITGYDSVNSVTWYLKKTGGDYKQLTTENFSTAVTANGGVVKLGLIVTGLNDKNITKDDLSAGYTVAGTATAGE